ncbi:Hint domain-containing protein [Fuscibacter oryzae]|uniref:Hint domain-containing protein n=1 Tax=Fuscibacter oryzae TaxID=2803939 RepID=A0A8J7MPL4_9RHOB|nr:Hint domain-containing protein [Fuscibacter oryzae]MBL4927663.1 Hint domain-containing protein [Fuscibacter oryzae]
MPVFADFNFDDTDGYARDSAPLGGEQLGIYLHGATPVGGSAVLDGRDDLVKIFPDPIYQMDQGTLNLSFSLGSAALTGPQTVLSRDAEGTNAGDFRVEVLADGSVLVRHEGADSTVAWQTAAGFAAPGDTVSLSYSWDLGGAGGNLVLANATTGGGFSAAVPNTLSLEQDGGGSPWTIGAGQSHTPAGSLQGFDQFFQGSVAQFQLSDTVDNATARDGIVSGTGGGDLIDTAYTGDPDGDRVDANDALLPGDGPNDDRIEAGAGNDLVHGDSGDDSLSGAAGDDTLYGGAGADLARGGDGNDLIATASGAGLPDRGYPGLYAADADPFDDRDTVYGGAGEDTIRTGDDADSVFGGGGHDLIDGGIDDDTLYGGTGNDTIIGAEGSDLIDGGAGDDLIYGGYGPGVPDAVNTPDDAGDLRPDNGADFILGGAGDDTIFGMDDADTIYGGSGNDLLDGGIDNDLIQGDDGADTLIGGHGNDTLMGGADNDRIDGGIGNDLIQGGAGADALFGGDDADTFVIGGAAEGAGDSVSGGSGGIDHDRLVLSGTGPFRLVDVVTDSDGNGLDGRVEFLDTDGHVTGGLNFSNIEEIVPCFTPGTLIATPRGEVPVENLRVGDKVITRDDGLQEIRWLGHKDLSWSDLSTHAHLKPVLVTAGSLGDGLPERDMMVSPNHRMLVANDRTSLYFDEHEVLVAAKHLLSGSRISTVDAAGLTYIHFMFDRHQVVLSNGTWAESFQPGDYSMKGIGNAQRQELFDLFPELKTDQGINDYHTARRVLRRHEAVLLSR